MHAQSLAGCLLLMLASVSVAETALDASVHHDSARLQWRARTQQQSAPRVSPRGVAIITGESPPHPLLAARGPAVPGDRPDSLPLVWVSVFVPPRV